MNGGRTTTDRPAWRALPAAAVRPNVAVRAPVCVGIASVDCAQSGRPSRAYPEIPEGELMMSNSNKTMAVRVDCDGLAARVPGLADREGDVMGWLRAQIGCTTVQPVVLGDRLAVWLDEDALMTADAEVNPVATVVAAQFGPLIQPLFGVAVFTGWDFRAGAVAVAPEAAAMITRIAELTGGLAEEG